MISSSGSTSSSPTNNNSNNGDGEHYVETSSLLMSQNYFTSSERSSSTTNSNSIGGGISLNNSSGISIDAGTTTSTRTNDSGISIADSNSNSLLFKSAMMNVGDIDTDDADVENNNDNTRGDKLSLLPLHHKGTIGMLGSVAIAVNSLTGPAMLTLPYQFQKSGIIPTTVTLILLCILSTFCSLHLANVISKVPGNMNFHKEIEYSETFRHFWGKKAFVFTHIAFFCCITCLNIASIVDTAQVVDQMISKQLNGGAVAFMNTKIVKDHGSSSSSSSSSNNMNMNMSVNDLDDNLDRNIDNNIKNEIDGFNVVGGGGDIDNGRNNGVFSILDWEVVRWDQSSCLKIHDNGQEEEGIESSDSADEPGDGPDGNYDFDDCIPFRNLPQTSLLVTCGYLLSALIFIPMSLKDLKENTFFQIIGFIILVVLSMQFVFSFISNGINMENVSLWGDDYSELFGVCLFNFAVVLAIPAWLYEKKPSVNVNTAINGSSFLAVIMYVLVGVLGAMTMHHVSENMLQSMMSGAFGETTEISSMIFAFFIIGLGIPLFSVLTRLNLTGSGLCSEFVANILAVYFPWGTAWMFYSGGATTSLLGWGGIFFTSIIAFLAPLLLAIHAVAEFASHGSIHVYGKLQLTKQQQIITLYGLLIFSIVSIVLAVIGELY